MTFAQRLALDRFLNRRRTPAVPNEPTIVQLIDAAIAQLDTYRAAHPGADAREFSLAITALEDAQMRATRGIAKVTGQFRPADLQA